MLAKPNTWKLQDAKARFSELVRKAREGEPQRVTMHGKEAVVVVDTTRFDIVPKPPEPQTMRDFIERSKKFRGAADGIDFDVRIPMRFKSRRIFDEHGE
jgi:prevent-host-death family protein